MWTWARALPLVAAAVAVAAVPACNRSGTAGGSGGKPKVAVVTNCTAEFWSICEAGARKAAQDNDVELFFRQPDRTWALDTASGLTSSARLRSLKIEMALNEVYAGVEFPPAAEAPAS